MGCREVRVANIRTVKAARCNKAEAPTSARSATTYSNTSKRGGGKLAGIESEEKKEAEVEEVEAEVDGKR